MGLGAEDIARLRRKLLDKGQELAGMLSDLLAGNTPEGLEALAAQPGETPEEKLRRYLGVIQNRLDQIRDGTYGRCERCGTELRLVELEEMPWADTCGDCASKGEAR